MKVLVLVTDYPKPEVSHAYMFVHVRNLYYKKQGINTVVLSFAAKENYCIDGIQVITKECYGQQKERYDVLISHASNLRNHYLFIKQYENRFGKLVFFFHGQEILKFREAYPQPYDFCNDSSFLKRCFRNRYDDLKIWLWKKYYKKLECKSDYIFVSQWIKKQFENNTGLLELKNTHVINNSVGAVFEKRNYDWNSQKDYDFITIRSNLDGSKYGVDIVCDLAENNPKMSFLVIGKGQFFNYRKKPKNMTVINTSLDHEEMLRYLNLSRCGLLPTREDTQGVMTCEMITFGMPVITSDIEVCHEFFSNLPNVKLIDNNDKFIDLTRVLSEIATKKTTNKIDRYFSDKTISKEIEIINSRR